MKYLIYTNIILYLLSFLYLWLPFTFKRFSFVWFIYSRYFFVAGTLYLLNKSKKGQMILMLTGALKYIDFEPDNWVTWDNVPKHYRGISISFLVYLIFSLVISIYYGL